MNPWLANMWRDLVKCSARVGLACTYAAEVKSAGVRPDMLALGNVGEKGPLNC